MWRLPIHYMFAEQAFSRRNDNGTKKILTKFIIYIWSTVTYGTLSKGILSIR